MYESEFLHCVVLSSFSQCSLSEDIATGKDVFRWCLLLVLFAFFSLRVLYGAGGFLAVWDDCWSFQLSSSPWCHAAPWLRAAEGQSNSLWSFCCTALWGLSWAKRWWMWQESFPRRIWRNKTRLRLGDFKSPAVELKTAVDLLFQMGENMFYLNNMKLFTTCL